MTNLDQAFIKVYQQQVADTPSPERVPLNEVSRLADSCVSDGDTSSMRLHQQVLGSAVPAPHIDFASAYSTEQAPDEEPFRPLLEVEGFSLPPMCRQLYEVAPAELNMLADALVRESSQGLKVLAIDGYSAGEGTTTLLLCLAARLSQIGIKVAVADANLDDPQVAPRLGLDVQTGWEDVLRDDLPLEEVVIEAADGLMAILPLKEPLSLARGTTQGLDDRALRMAASIKKLRSGFGLVLIDMSPLDNPGAFDRLLPSGFGSQLDAILLTHNVRATPHDRIAELQSQLRAVGVAQAGIVETFVPAA
jgi:Mrp family chromosome partitioning ATPase